MFHPLRLHRDDARLRTGWAAIVVIFGLWLGISPTVEASDARTRTEVQSLDQQVQDIKSEVLSIAAELRTLEEQLLHPSSTQVAIFVEIGREQDVLVDAARLWIDDEVVAHHVYTHQELEALRQGGVQRLYTGNLREGRHALRVEIEGRRTSAGRFTTSEEFVLDKAVGPKKVGVRLSDALTGGAQVAIADW
ncbi:MAG: hypothetical protein AAGC67_05000 [Myxococcota bacterium]